MFTAERRQVILSALTMHGSISVTDLSRMMSASEVTIRRDLHALHESGHLVRRRGGATIARFSFDEQSYLEKSVVAAEQKMDIAAFAASLVQDGDTIMLCAGTTTQALARLLARKRLMVVTNSLLVANELFDVSNIDLYVVGGTVRGSIRAVIGGEAERAVERLKFDKVFLSGNGLSAANGLSTPNMQVAGLDRAAVRSARHVVAVVDHTKVGVDSLARTVPTADIDVLVTDSLADAHELELITAAGVTVEVAPARPGSEILHPPLPLNQKAQ